MWSLYALFGIFIIFFPMLASQEKYNEIFMDFIYFIRSSFRIKTYK